MAGRDRYRAGKRLWSAADDRLMRRRYPDMPTSDLAKQLRRSVAATYNRAKHLGLVKSAAYMASPAAYLMRRHDLGAAFRFPKGHVPANKGLRRPGYAPGRMKETQFKTGQPPRNYMPVGSTRLIEGYLYRKVSDVPYVPYTVNWKQEHVLLWERVRGPVPKGLRLRFVNGDRTDIRLNNLALVTPREMMARNSVHNLPPELASTIQLLGALNRQIRKREGHAEEKQD